MFLALLGLSGGYYWLSTSLPDAERSYTVAGIADAVEISRDERGIPRIRARTESDAYFALGFVHAQDRLWQMEAMRRFGAGRLAQVLGPKGLASDRFMRTLGVTRLAREQVRALDQKTRAVLESYAAGVNAWMAAHGGALPPEFIALRFRPEPWKPADSLIWGKIMAMRLSGNWQDEMLRARLAGRLTAERIAELWPAHPPGGSAGAIAPPPVVSAPAVPGLPRGASNGWVVAGALTASGKPLLANDPHLGFGAPVLWYLVRMEAPGFSLAGATVPGVPFTIIGHNRHIAWGVSSTETDMQDLFTEQIDPDDAGRYLVPGGSRPFETRREVIAVKDADDVVLTVRVSRHGPVVSDKFAGEGKVFALAAPFLERGDTTPGALSRINRAGGWDEFLAAVRGFHAPQLNMIYADTDGNIGFIAPGKVPIRTRSLFPRQGWTGAEDWRGFIPFARLPRSFNPGRGRIITANNRVVPDGYPYYITDDWAPGYRARRIGELLDESRPQSPRTTARIQGDHVSLMARHLLPMMLNLRPGEDRERRALALLEKWDGTMSRERPEPAIFSAWLRQFNRAVYGDELGDLLGGYWKHRPRFIASVLGGRGPWCDDVGTPETEEDCAGRLALALERALDGLEERLGADMEDWRWGDLHRALFRHRLFSALPGLGPWADLAIATDGGGYTVNRGAFRVSDSKHPFQHIHGPGLRAIFDLSDLDKSLFMIATGQSGNPLSPHYGDMLEDWRDGRYLRLDGKSAGLTRLLPPPAD